MAQQYHVPNGAQQMRGVYVQSLNGQPLTYATPFGQAGSAQSYAPYPHTVAMAAPHLASQAQTQQQQQALYMNMVTQQNYQNILRSQQQQQQQAAAVAAAQQQQQQQLRSTPPQQSLHGAGQQPHHYPPLQASSLLGGAHTAAVYQNLAYPQYYTQQLGGSVGASGGAVMLGGAGGTPPSLTPTSGAMPGMGPGVSAMPHHRGDALSPHVQDPSGAGGASAGGAADGLAKGSVLVEDEYGLKPLLKRSEPLPAFLPTAALPVDGERVEPETGRTPSQLQRDKANFMCLMRGIDMTSLGLQLVQLDPLYPTVATLPMDDHHYYVLPEIKIPDCYKKPKPRTLTMKCFSQYKEETLFYIFYSMPRDVLHLAAARALYERNWRYDKNRRQWFRPAREDVVLAKTGAAAVTREEISDYEGKGSATRGQFEVFNPSTWETTLTAADYVVVDADVEKESVLRAAMDDAARHNAQQSKSSGGSRAAHSQAASPPPAAQPTSADK